jgi:hypothetical protein
MSWDSIGAPMQENIITYQKLAIAVLPKRNLCLRNSRLAQLHAMAVG